MELIDIEHEEQRNVDADPEHPIKK